MDKDQATTLAATLAAEDMAEGIADGTYEPTEADNQPGVWVVVARWPWAGQHAQVVWTDPDTSFSVGF